MFIGIGMALQRTGKSGPPGPVNSVAPVLSGTTTEGSVLSCTTGTWSGSPTYAYQWKRGAANVGTNANTYTLVAGDIGSNMTCVVTATNAGGAASATSNSLGPVTVAVQGLNPSDKAAAITLTNSNRTAEITGSPNASVRSVTTRATGKYHFEVTMDASPGSGSHGMGVCPSSMSLTDVPSFAAPGGFYQVNGYIGTNGGGGFGLADAWTTPGDTAVFEVDLDTDEFWVEKLGGTGRKGPFATGAIGTTYAFVGGRTTGDKITINTGQAAFAITPTSGFAAWG